MPANPRSAIRTPQSEIRTGLAARRALAHDLVALLEHDMQYLGWFLAVARQYPDDAAAMDWSSAMEVARCSRAPLQVAEALSRGPRLVPSTIRTPAQVAALRAQKHLSRRGPVGPRLNRHR